MPRYIAIEGPIRVGKTSLLERLKSVHTDIQRIFDVSDNPYLPDFYQDKPGISFHTQLHFLIRRYQLLQQVPNLLQEGSSVISDFLFAKDKLFACLNLDDQELQTYDAFYNTLSKNVRIPDLVIYLQAPLETLLERIKRRQTAYEQNIAEDYLLELIEAYDHFFFRYKQSPLLVIKAAGIDFVRHQEDLENLTNIIFHTQIHGVQYYSPRGR